MSDLAELDFIDSAGLRFLLAVANAQYSPVRLENARPPITRIVELTGVTALFDFESC